MKKTVIHFSALLCGGSRRLDASVIAPGHIVFSKKWKKVLAQEASPVVQDAFDLTLQHELVHMQGDYCFGEWFSTSARFVNWVSEAHADCLGATNAFAENFTGRALAAFDWKRAQKLAEKQKDLDSRTHPSWERRIQYFQLFAQKQAFGPVIDQIAKDTGCTSERLIEKVHLYYSGSQKVDD